MVFFRWKKKKPWASCPKQMDLSRLEKYTASPTLTKPFRTYKTYYIHSLFLRRVIDISDSPIMNPTIAYEDGKTMKTLENFLVVYKTYFHDHLY